MVYSAMMEIKINDSSALIIRGGVDGGKCHLQFELPNEKRSIKAEWTQEDIVKFGTRDLPEGLPVKITLDGTQSKNMYYRNKFLYEPGESQPYSLQIPAWTELGMRLGRGAAALPEVDIDPLLTQARSLGTWGSCVSSSGGVGAGIGTMIGGGPGAVTGGAIGTAFGLGYCTTSEATGHPGG